MEFRENILSLTWILILCSITEINGSQTPSPNTSVTSRSPSPPSSPSGSRIKAASSPGLVSSVARVVEGNHYNLLLVAATAAALHQKEVDESKSQANRSPTSKTDPNQLVMTIKEEMDNLWWCIWSCSSFLFLLYRWKFLVNCFFTLFFNIMSFSRITPWAHFYPGLIRSPSVVIEKRETVMISQSLVVVPTRITQHKLYSLTNLIPVKQTLITNSNHDRND